MGAPARSAAPLIDAALADGRIGEQADGYLGFTEPPDNALRKAVLDINIRRREGYTRRAITQNVTVAEFAAAAGCLLLRTLPVGHAYRIGDGPWHVRAPGEVIAPPDCG